MPTLRSEQSFARQGRGRAFAAAGY